MSSSDESTVYNNKKKLYLQKYRMEWEQKTEFSSWLSHSKKGTSYFHCKACNNDNLGGLSAVRKHSNSVKHIKNNKSIKNTTAIDKMNRLTYLNRVERLKKEAEIKISMFITEHNISFRTSDHLVALIKNVCPESEVIKKITCNRSKATAIVKNTIGKQGFEDLVEKLKTQYFSILIDESTDKSSIKHLAIVVRILDQEDFIVRDQFACLTEISDASAQSVYDAILNFFQKNSVPYKNNLIGYASDGANTMFGKHHSVKTLLEKDVEDLFVLKCVCHSLALCASYACTKLPNDVEQLMREIYTYMKYSFKRQTEFSEFQVFVDTKPHKMLQPSQTRWLSLHSCVKRVLEQYKALKLYFDAEHLLDHKASEICFKLNDIKVELYLHFLDFVLPILTNLNIEFQSESPKLHTLYSKMFNAYKTLLDCYIKPDYLTNNDITVIQYRNPEFFLNNKEIYLGGKCSAALNVFNKNFPDTEKNIFITNCLNFVIECCHQIYHSFPFNSPWVQALKHLSFIEPTNINNIKSIAVAASYFERKLDLNLNDLDREFRQLKNCDISKDLDMYTFWKAVKNLTNCEGSPVYPLLIKFVSYIVTLPHSSACVERLFSTINLNKTKTRNRLATNTLSGILYSKNVLINQQKSCHDFNVTNEMIKKHNSDMYENY